MLSLCVFEQIMGKRTQLFFIINNDLDTFYFLQNTLFYDTWWVGQHVFLTWLSAFLMLCAHFLPPRYLDLMHRCSQHLGRWQKVEGRHAHVPYNAYVLLYVPYMDSDSLHKHAPFKV